MLKSYFFTYWNKLTKVLEGIVITGVVIEVLLGKKVEVEVSDVL